MKEPMSPRHDARLATSKAEWHDTFTKKRENRDHGTDPARLTVGPAHGLRPRKGGHRLGDDARQHPGGGLSSLAGDRKPELALRRCPADEVVGPDPGRSGEAVDRPGRGADPRTLAFRLE